MSDIEVIRDALRTGGSCHAWAHGTYDFSESHTALSRVAARLAETQAERDAYAKRLSELPMLCAICSLPLFAAAVLGEDEKWVHASCERKAEWTQEETEARLAETQDALRDVANRVEAELERWSRGVALDAHSLEGALAVARAALLGDDEQDGKGQIPEPPEAASSTEVCSDDVSYCGQCGRPGAPETLPGAYDDCPDDAPCRVEAASEDVKA